MGKNKIYNHDSYGMIQISKFFGKSTFFGSDIEHNGGITLRIKTASKERKLNSEWFSEGVDVVEVRMSHSQFVDAITSGMNTSGVPCTIQYGDGKRIPQIAHIEDKKELFSNDIKETQSEYIERINELLSKLDGNIGKKKVNEIKHDLEVLKSHIKSNTGFVMNCFNESMEKTVTEAKQSVAGYIDQKIYSLGAESFREELNISIEPKKLT